MTLAGQNKKNAYSISNILQGSDHKSSHLPHYSNDAQSYRGCPLDVKYLVEPFLVLRLLPNDTENHIEYAVKEYDNKNQDVSVVLGLVDCHKEAVPFQYQGHH